jgi:DNA polymerase I-like protein with 3'-5' exonuclease and polymerase domains
MTSGQVKAILDKFYGRYDGVAQYLKNLEAEGVINGYAQNIFGLRRYRYNKSISPNYWEKNWFKNFPVQSTAAVIFKNAIIKIAHRFRGKSFNLLVPLYDSIVFESPKSELNDTTDQIVKIMTSSMTEFFPMLKPRISTTKEDPSCWNHGGNADSIEKFLSDPLHGIDIYEHQTGNVDWSKYL